MHTLSKAYFSSLSTEELPPVNLRDMWTDNFLQADFHKQTKYQQISRDKTFLQQLNMLMTKTNNLELSDKAINNLQDSFSVGTGKLVQALLLERQFLLGLVKAFVSPHIPTLQNLLQGPNTKSVPFQPV
jgi:hypothetical protein